MLLLVLQQDVSVAKEAALVLGEMVKNAAKNANGSSSLVTKEQAHASASAESAISGNTLVVLPTTVVDVWHGVWLPVLAAGLQGPSTLLRKRLAQLVLPKLFDVISRAPHELLQVQLGFGAVDAGSATGGTRVDAGGATGGTSVADDARCAAVGQGDAYSDRLAGLITTLKVAHSAKHATFEDALPIGVLEQAVYRARVLNREECVALG
jgi:hypothetical protein